MTSVADPHTTPKQPTEDVTRLGGLLAEFTTPDALVSAAAKVRDAGYRKFDCHSPYPIHGIDDAMGVKPTILPVFVLIGGLTGVTIGLLFQLWANGIDYPWIISGKPLFAVPANIPISFETTILLSALTAFFGLMALCGLPELYHKVFTAKSFHRFSDDRFFLSIDAKDAKFSADATRGFLDTLSPESVEEMREPASPAGTPRQLILGGIVLAIAALVPLFYYIKSASELHTQPRVQLVFDMDYQPKVKTQVPSLLFADGRAMRPPVFGAVASGFYKDDESVFFTGKNEDGSWSTGLPIVVDTEAIKRGQERYNIQCAACHGYDGQGQGMVNKRALAAGGGKWVQAANLVTGDRIPTLPVGYTFNVISHGVPRQGEPGAWSMPGYASSISPADRWAIVLYMEVLQRQYTGSVDDLSPEQRQELEQLGAGAPAAGGDQPPAVEEQAAPEANN